MEEAVAATSDAPEVVVIGGGEVFQSFADLVQRMYLTFVDGDFRGTAHFPESIPMPAGFAWRETHRELIEADEKNRYPHQYVVVELVDGARIAGGSTGDSHTGWLLTATRRRLRRGARRPANPDAVTGVQTSRATNAFRLRSGHPGRSQFRRWEACHGAEVSGSCRGRLRRGRSIRRFLLPADLDSVVLQRLGSLRSRKFALGALAELLANQRKCGLDADFLWRLHERNLLTAGIVLMLSGLSGWAIFRALVRPPRTEVASDYQEGPGGSLRDGRG